MKQSFSKSKFIPLREAFAEDGEVFGKEATDFTPWLCKDDHLNYYLGEALGMTLEEPQNETKVGRALSLDILCTNTKDKSLVAIENQFGTADHKHLGQIMTYGAVLKAPTMVWIAEDFTEEHITALKWLNKNTNLNKNSDKKFRFFGVKVEVRKMNDFENAIDFVVVAHPSDWRKPKSRGVQKTKKGIPTSLQIMQKLYWQALVDYIKTSDSKLRLRKPYPQSGHVFPIGHNGIYIGAIMDTKKKTIAVEFCMEDSKISKRYFGILEKEKAQIEKEIGAKLEWRNKSKNISTKIILFKDADPKNEYEWADQHAWLKETIEKFYRVLTPRVGIIDL